MIGTGSETQRPGFLTPAVLIIVKLLALPLLNRQMVNLLQAGANVSDTTDLSTYAFLYGTFPSAPGVFVIATQYQTDIDLIATSMVACTFISGPLMFISAKMISLTNLNPADYLHELDNFALDISAVGMFACVWVLLLFGLTKRWRRMPQRVTCCLVISQVSGHSIHERECGSIVFVFRIVHLLHRHFDVGDVGQRTRVGNVHTIRSVHDWQLQQSFVDGHSGDIDGFPAVSQLVLCAEIVAVVCEYCLRSECMFCLGNRLNRS